MGKPRRWARATAGVASSLVLAASGFAGAGALALNNLGSNIQQRDFSELLGDRPTKPTTAINLVVLGSDTREGQGGGYGSSAIIEGARSDTTMLIHISADRQRVLGVSIPRDSLVQIPSCKTADGVMSAPYYDRFNEAFSIGGPACTVKTIEALTGVYIDHFLVVDFRGFKSVVNALGGVEVCLKQPVYDYKSKLNLPAGRQTISGEDALAFVRARYAFGDGSDISRLDRQQDFVSAAIRKATSRGVLTNPVKLYRVLDAGTKSLATDHGFGLTQMRELAESLTGVRPEQVSFLTVPWVGNADMSTVSWYQPKAQPLFDAIKNDTPYPPPTTVPDGQSALTIAADKIDVRVLNGTSTPGNANVVGGLLAEQGYKVVEMNGFPREIPRTVIKTGRLNAEAARTVAYAVGASKVKIVKDPYAPIAVIIGGDFHGVKTVVVNSPKGKPSGDRFVKPRPASENNACY